MYITRNTYATIIMSLGFASLARVGLRVRHQILHVRNHHLEIGGQRFVGERLSSGIRPLERRAAIRAVGRVWRMSIVRRTFRRRRRRARISRMPCIERCRRRRIGTAAGGGPEICARNVGIGDGRICGR